MKTLIALLTLSAVTIAQEAEAIPQEHAQKFARMMTEKFGSPSDAPLAVDVDAEKAVGIKGGQVGVVAIPDKKLTVEVVEKAGTETKGIGQLWMHKAVPAVGESAADPAKLRSTDFTAKEETKRVEVYFLGVSKAANGDLTLALFAKDKEPLVKVPLVKTTAATSTEPITLAAHKDDEASGTLVVSVFGNYKADITLKRPRE